MVLGKAGDPARNGAIRAYAIFSAGRFETRNKESRDSWRGVSLSLWNHWLKRFLRSRSRRKEYDKAAKHQGDRSEIGALVPGPPPHFITFEIRRRQVCGDLKVTLLATVEVPGCECEI
ncbi:hypothetical protein NGR_b09690 (plasmid) [Sinorhizobium fredii NGR234]|uniref:Uncharacterized protein n=1 Tax=Sinorhizobium fredii (strain NBRC 101917 / NGR234) TaxID=394 RepID=C3KQR4_SINFN|nr:hypothetical protein NGR_b09690 [Sinorhizobium fredii NGR234]